MEKTIRYCDHCGKTSPGIERFQVPTGTEKDVPSGRTEETSTEVDLCTVAVAQIVRESLNQARFIDVTRVLTMDERVAAGQAFVRRWKKVT